MPANYKIAITGTSGVGKTTLALALANKYQIEYVPEDWNALLLTLKMYKSEVDISLKKDKLDQFIETLNSWIKKRKQISIQGSGFVMDRCIFDILKLAIHESVFAKQPQAIKKLIQQSISFSKNVDCIIVPPLSSWMMEKTVNESGLKRNNDLQHKIYSQSLTVGLLEQFSASKKIYLSRDNDTINQRLTVVDQYIA